MSNEQQIIESRINIYDLSKSDSIYNITNSNREIDYSRNPLSERINGDEYKTITTENNNNDGEKSINVSIFRYKFSDDFTKELYSFSKIHQYDERKDFKEAWNTWTEENIELVNSEVDRLSNLGYEGDILDKMFKSARYYFRKKSTEQKEPKSRREYVSVEKELLTAMDKHIMSNINSENYKPADGFLEFCNDNIDILKTEVARLCKSGINNTNDVKDKIKKTYKNRYFMFISK
jgi:hypothetical protein